MSAEPPPEFGEPPSPSGHQDARARGGSTVLWLLVTAGGLGSAPRAPGTVGTLGGVVLGAPIVCLLSAPGTQVAVLAGLAAILLLAGSLTTAYSLRAFRVKDPSPFVLDEVVGYLVTLALMVPFWGASALLLFAVAFGLFRFFDILKPWPVGPAERLPGAVGIMADDVVAGLLAGAVGIGLAHVL